MSGLRKVLLWSFIGFLSLTALLAVSSLIANVFGPDQWKILATTFSISAASICAMSCAAFIEKRGHKTWGAVGIFFAAVAVAAAIWGIWMESGSEVFWKTTAVLIVVSVGLAHGLLLLIPTLVASHKWTQKVAVVLISVLALQISYFICTEASDDSYRFIGVTSVLVVLMTFVVPICSKLGGKQPGSLDRLVLEKISGDIYVDQSGRKLRVTVVEND